MCVELYVYLKCHCNNKLFHKTRCAILHHRVSAKPDRVVLGAGAMQLALRTPLPLRMKRYTLPSNRSITHLTQLCMCVLSGTDDDGVYLFSDMTEDETELLRQFALSSSGDPSHSWYRSSVDLLIRNSYNGRNRTFVRLI